MNVFISGSRDIKTFDERVLDVLYDELNASANILVGDADGVDAELQKFCRKHDYKNVTVYAANGKARNNSGFPVKNILTDKNMFYKNFFIQKDIAMTDSADFGIVIWDGKSKGSLNNINRLVQQNKPCHVYLADQSRWVWVHSERDFATLKNPEVAYSGTTQMSFI